MRVGVYFWCSYKDLCVCVCVCVVLVCVCRFFGSVFASFAVPLVRPPPTHPPTPPYCGAIGASPPPPTHPPLPIGVYSVCIVEVE
jgi:hypothetical protein